MKSKMASKARAEGMSEKFAGEGAVLKDISPSRDAESRRRESAQEMRIRQR
jgi:hypothetical protein